ncbi:MAG: hypothetical protein M1827_005460 [Pycnora praestabilis]|nr:MAG: hypothetical protein M1827_005460 [Pycnora praestabilis]
MAMYGKKKKGLLASFSVFQEGREKLDGRDKSSAYTRLANDKPGSSPVSKSKSYEPDKSIDDITNALLDDTHRIDESLGTGHSSPDELTLTRSTTMNKPLPGLPEDSVVGGRELPRDVRSVLGSMTTNPPARLSSSSCRTKPALRAISWNKNNLISSQPSIPPQRARSASGADVLDNKIQELSFDDESGSSPLITSTGAEQSSRKVEDLTATTSVDLSRNPSSNDLLGKTKPEGGSPRLYKSIQVFAKVKGVISDRLGGRTERSGGVRQKGIRHLHANDDSMEEYEGSSYRPEPEDNASLQRRLRAEGRNLVAPKIKMLTGSGAIPRKPLPKDHRARPSRSDADQSESLLSSEQQLGEVTPKEEIFGFATDSVPGEGLLLSVSHAQPSQDFPEHARKVSAKTTKSRSSTISQYSDAVSGLAQHSDPYVFSSSPIEQSTPRLRLKPPPSSDAEDDLQIAPVKVVPRLVGLSSTGERSSGTSLDAGHHELARRTSSSSLKRKDSDQHAEALLVSRPTKKVKRIIFPNTTREEMLAEGIKKLESGVLAAKDTNTKIIGDLQKGISGKGLNIFDTGKSSMPQPPPAVIAKRPRGRPSKKSLIPKPVGNTPGRERRASGAVMGIYNSTRADTNDDMDADELQLDSTPYRIAYRKR